MKYIIARGEEEDANVLRWHPESQIMVEMRPRQFLNLVPVFIQEDINYDKRKTYILLEKVYDNEFMNESLGFEILYEIIDYGKNLKAIATKINNKIKNG